MFLMDTKEILSHVDLTLLKEGATWEEIKQLCDDGLKYGCASVCIPPCYVKQCGAYLGNAMKICTVIGFPNGYTTTSVKVFETEEAIRGGADEIDMVANISWIKDGRWDELQRDIEAVKDSCQGRILKVIVEVCLLTEEEKIKACQVVTAAGAEYIKTSTGFASKGATREDIVLFRQHIGPHVKIKASGGINTLEQAEEFLKLGADRLGSSRLVKLVKEQEGA
jgi:deoxyribose-phosphate aldolase